MSHHAACVSVGVILTALTLAWNAVAQILRTFPIPAHTGQYGLQRREQESAAKVQRQASRCGGSTNYAACATGRERWWRRRHGA
jgi:hypothetical protein